MALRRSAPSLLALALLIGGCGQVARPRQPSGAAVFGQECQVCHSLIGNESLNKDGGDLLGYRMTARQMNTFAREMPVRHRLSSPELRAVVRFVLHAERSKQ
ncbi:MAG TPA: cytochrome c [Solirubrobacteraceae bacterium]|jgi:mono/diheme cytochrome c family protein|nr:cytochrome c [Solirubrobacteraceae bacterium]